MARKSRVATVYMQVAPSMDGFFSKISKDVNSQMPNIGSKAGGGFGKSLANGAGKAFTTAWKALKVGTLVTAGITGGLAAAFATKTLKGGISRALNLEDAQATLKGLGYEAEAVKSITDDVLGSVRGTAFALDDAMTIAASALAAGVPQGEGLTEYLKLIGDTATITKSGLGEIGGIFNRVQATGRAFTMELNMLADRGLPIFTWLQEEYGVTAEELRKMVAAGEVDAKTFAKVIEENIGGAALTSADTTRGALANVGAAMSRLGAVAVGGGLPVFKDMLVSFIPLLDSFAEKLTPIAEQFWATFGPQATSAFQDFLDWILGLLDGTTKLPSVFQLVAEVLNNWALVLNTVKPLIESIIPVLTTLAQTVGSVLTPILDGLTNFFQQNAGALEAYGRELLSILGQLGPSLDTIAPIIANLGTIFANLLASLSPLLPALLSIGVDIANTIMPVILEFTNFLKDNKEILEVLTVAVLSAVVAFKGFLIISKIIGFFKALSVMFVAIKGGATLAAAAQTAFNIALTANPIGIIIAAIAGLVAGLIWFFTQTKLGQKIWSGFVSFLKDAVKNIGRWIGDVADGIGKFFTDIGDGIANFFRNVVGFVMDIGKKILNFYIGIYKGIANFIIGIINTQRRAINFLIDMLNRIKIPVPDWAQDLFGGTKEIGFNIPKLKDIPQLAVGANVMGPTLALVGENRPEAVTDLGLTNRLIDNANRLAAAALAGSGGVTGGDVYNIEVDGTDRESNKELAVKIRRELAKQNRR